MAQVLYYKQLASGVATTGSFYLPGSTGQIAFPNPTGFLTAQAVEWTVYIVGSAGISAGTIKLETAHDPTYSGTWAQVGSDITATASAVKVANVNGSYAALRARISTAVADGTIDVWVLGTDQS